MDSMLTHHAYLSGLSALAERRFSSLAETVMATLQSVAAQLCVQSSFVLDLDQHTQVLAISAAHNADAESTILPGAHWPLTANVDAAAPLFAPCVLEDITTAPISAPFLADPVFAHVGCYISVPIILADGTVSGFLCGVDGDSHQFAAAQIEVMILLANQLATAIDRDREQAARRNVEAQLQHALATLRTAHGEMEHMQRLKNDFVTVVSHEFRTALTGIQGFSEIVRDEECSIDEVKEFAADINADARRLSRLITDMLDLDRMETGKLRLAAGRVNLNVLIDEVVTHLRPTAPRHDIQTRLDPGLLTLTGDGDKLAQALTHLLHNAIKFSPGGGTVGVSTRRDDNAAYVSVQDDGIGIPANDLERIFERYARVETGTGRYIQGTGLGLSIVRDIVQLHGGKTWAESVSGQGATFHMAIPITSTR